MSRFSAHIQANDFCTSIACDALGSTGFVMLLSDPLLPLRWHVQVVAFCGKQARSSSTDKREAACACMSELAVKIDQLAVEPHVGPMLRCLLGCFRDSSWPVSRSPNRPVCTLFGTAGRREPHMGPAPRCLPSWFRHSP